MYRCASKLDQITSRKWTILVKYLVWLRIKGYMLCARFISFWTLNIYASIDISRLLWPNWRMFLYFKAAKGDSAAVVLGAWWELSTIALSPSIADISDFSYTLRYFRVSNAASGFGFSARRGCVRVSSYWLFPRVACSLFGAPYWGVVVIE